jgi:putative hydrolase of the HAD superfamily
VSDEAWGAGTASAPVGAAADGVGIVRAVTFDVDGTLYHHGAVRACMVWKNLRRLRALRVGRRVREELRARAFADGDALRAEEARMAAERLGLEPAATRLLLDDIFDRTLCECLRSAALPEVRSMLGALRERGVLLGAVSDRRIDDKLSALGVDPGWFGVRLSADETGLLKPDPELLRRAAAALEVPLAALVHVGDRDDADGELARRAGARFVLVAGPREACAAAARMVRPPKADELDDHPRPP